MNKIIRDVWKAIKGVTSKVEKELQPVYKNAIKDLKIKKYKEDKSVTLLAPNKEIANQIKTNFLKTIQEKFNEENNSKYKFKITHSGIKLVPIILPLVGTVGVLAAVGVGVYKCSMASRPIEKQLVLSGGSSLLTSPPNQAGIDGKKWTVTLGDDVIGTDSVYLSIAKAGDNPLPDHVSITKAGQVTWTNSIATGSHKFIVKAVYEYNNKTYIATSTIINLIVGN